MLEDETFRAAIREVFHGGGTPAQRTLVTAYLDDASLQTAEAMLRDTRRAKARARSPFLTPREREILRLLSVGYTTAEVAPELCMAPSTVKAHIQHALSRTHSRHRVHLVARFARGEVR